MIVVAPARTAPWMTLSPTPPQPTTRTLDPGRTSATLSTAPTPVTTAQASRHITSIGASLPILTHMRSPTTAYSAKEPMPIIVLAGVPSTLRRVVPSPIVPMMAAIRAGSPHRWNRPAPHSRQRPQGPFIATMTWSPGRTAVTPAPTLSTTPALSWPRTKGGRRTTGLLPSRALMSEPHTPEAAILTRTSPGPGAAISMSRISISAPNAVSTAARINIRRAPSLAPWLWCER